MYHPAVHVEGADRCLPMYMQEGKAKDDQAGDEVSHFYFVYVDCRRGRSAYPFFKKKQNDQNDQGVPNASP